MNEKHVPCVESPDTRTFLARPKDVLIRGLHCSSSCTSITINQDASLISKLYTDNIAY